MCRTGWKGSWNCSLERESWLAPAAALDRRKRTPILPSGDASGEAAGGGNGNGSAAALETGAGGSPDDEGGPDRDSLTVNLQGGEFDAARVSMLTNRNFLLTAGMM